MTQGTQYAGRPTTYRGIQMRSRLEARYAAWLDAYATPWRYEPQCFAGGSGQYLPDFVLRDVSVIGRIADVYVEVKPTLTLAYAVPERMSVIWESLPDAVLVIEVAEYDKPIRLLFSTGHGIGLVDQVWGSDQDRRLLLNAPVSRFWTKP